MKNGRIVLPQHLQREWKNAEIEIRESSEHRIVIERAVPSKKQEMLDALEATAGILKGRIPDPVAWQRKIRKEWDRKLPRFHVHR